MASSTNFFASSPAVALPSIQPNPYFPSHHHASTNGNAPTPSAFSIPITPNGSIPPTPGALAGRKRSRADIHAPEDDEQLGDGSLPTPSDSGPESGSFMDAEMDGKPFELRHIKRPSFSSRKSQRKNAGAAGSEDLAQLVLPPSIREATTEPLIDEATRVLGISWKRMDATETSRISQAAYSKWIQNHYSSLKDVAVWFENSAIPGYLVQARNAYTGQQEYYIFSNDLTEARLVTTEPSQLVPRLKMLPALHLAAPGGHIRAETDPITAAQNEVNGVQEDMAASIVSRAVSELNGQVQDPACPGAENTEPREPNGMCSAHEMEMD